MAKDLLEVSKRCIWVVTIFVMSNYLEQFAANCFTIVEFERLIPANSKISVSQPESLFHFLKII